MRERTFLIDLPSAQLDNYNQRSNFHRIISPPPNAFRADPLEDVQIGWLVIGSHHCINYMSRYPRPNPDLQGLRHLSGSDDARRSDLSGSDYVSYKKAHFDAMEIRRVAQSFDDDA